MFAPDMNSQTGKFEKNEKIKEQLQDFLIKHKIEFINLTNHFKKFPHLNYYIKNDGHYSILHKLAFCSLCF